MAEGYLIDTSVVIKYLNESLDRKGIGFLDKIMNEDWAISFVTFVTEIELQVWNPPDPEDMEIYHIFAQQSKTLLADNDKDFKRVSNLRYINPNFIS